MEVSQPRPVAGLGLLGFLLAALLSACGGDSSSPGAGTSATATVTQPVDPTTVVRSSEKGPAVSAPVTALVADDDTEDARIKANLHIKSPLAPAAVRRAGLLIGGP